MGEWPAMSQEHRSVMVKEALPHGKNALYSFLPWQGTLPKLSGEGEARRSPESGVGDSQTSCTQSTAAEQRSEFFTYWNIYEKPHLNVVFDQLALFCDLE